MALHRALNRATGTAPLRRPGEIVTRRIRDFDHQGEHFVEIVTRYLTCGHEVSGRPRKDGRYPCYGCRDGVPVQVPAQEEM